MLSRRDKVLVQPWELRRFRDHRSKVERAAAAVDARAPAPRPHVQVKAKRRQHEHERARRVLRENCRLLQELAHIMSVNRLDNHWPKPLPRLQQKVGMYCEAARPAPPAPPRSPPPAPARGRCYACEVRKKRAAPPSGQLRVHSLPPI